MKYKGIYFQLLQDTWACFPAVVKYGRMFGGVARYQSMFSSCCKVSKHASICHMRVCHLTVTWRTCDCDMTCDMTYMWLWHDVHVTVTWRNGHRKRHFCSCLWRGTLTSMIIFCVEYAWIYTCTHTMWFPIYTNKADTHIHTHIQKYKHKRVEVIQVANACTLFKTEPLSQSKETDRQTDRQTERKTDRQGQTDRHKTHLLRLQLRSTDRLRDLLRDDFLRMIRCLGPKMSVIDTKEAQLMCAAWKRTRAKFS